jgi:AcrR family transcriptional regulator
MTATSLNASPVPRRPRVRERTHRQRDELLRRAAQLIARKGYEATAIRDLSGKVGKSLAGMYYYISSKEDLLFQIQYRTFASLLEAQEAVAARPGTPEQRFRRLLEGHLGFFGRHPNEMKVCAYELESLSGEPYWQIERLRRRYYHLMADVVAGLMNGGSRRRESARSRHVTLFIFGMLNWVFMWHDPRRDGPVEGLAAEMLDLVLHGLPRPRKPSPR